ncbi:MAG: hypothetical protein ACE5NA_06965 [Nitrospiraceae bacterium]
MGTGRSLHKSGDQWHEAIVTDVTLSDTMLTLDIEAAEGDRVSVTLGSKDGTTYKGDYRYREGSNSNGEAFFERYRGPTGDLLVGEWHEAGGPKGDWIIKID